MPFGSDIYIHIKVPWVLQYQDIYGYFGLCPKYQEWFLAFSSTFRMEMPFERAIYIFLSNLCHVVSEYIWSLECISKIQGFLAGVFLHLQEVDALCKSYRYSGAIIVCSLQSIFYYSVQSTVAYLLQCTVYGQLFFC